MSAERIAWKRTLRTASFKRPPASQVDGPVPGPADLLRVGKEVISDDARAVAALGEKIGPDFVEAVLLLSSCRGKVHDWF
jgi:hypothetical protein